MLEESARLFAHMVYRGAGGAADVALARHWAEVAASIDGHFASTDTRFVLAEILLGDSASEADAARACALLEDITGPSEYEGQACYYRACCLRDGKGVAPDWDLALELLVRADANGLYGVADEIATLLRQMATTVPGRTAQLLIREADYYESKHAASEREHADDSAH